MRIKSECMEGFSFSTSCHGCVSFWCVERSEKRWKSKWSINAIGTDVFLQYTVTFATISFLLDDNMAIFAYSVLLLCAISHSLRSTFKHSVHLSLVHIVRLNRNARSKRMCEKLCQKLFRSIQLFFVSKLNIDWNAGQWFVHDDCCWFVSTLRFF